MDLAINVVADNSPPEMVWDSTAPRIEEGNGNTSYIRYVDSDEGDDIDDRYSL